jgi:hypothetical protein
VATETPCSRRIKNVRTGGAPDRLPCDNAAEPCHHQGCYGSDAPCRGAERGWPVCVQTAALNTLRLARLPASFPPTFLHAASVAQRLMLHPGRSSCLGA